MAGYVITGTRGAGKSLVAVARLRDYIMEGKPVATNIDLNLAKLVGRAPAAPVYRMPDRPTAEDFDALPAVHDTGIEEKNGALVLDECAVWLNAREWGDKDRQQIIDWLLHSRKRGWDLFFIVQAEGLLDKQARTTLFDYNVKCRRLDRLRIPLLGRVIEALTLGFFKGNMPKLHMGTVSYGFGPGAPLADTWFYRGKDLYDAYKTTQILSPRREFGVHAMLYPRAPKPASRVLKPKSERVRLTAAALGADEAWAVLARQYRKEALAA